MRKRTCNGCRALDFWTATPYPRCDLGYSQQTIMKLGMPVGAKPKEECPKPRTYNEWFGCEKKKSPEKEMVR